VRRALTRFLARKRLASSRRSSANKRGVALAVAVALLAFVAAGGASAQPAVVKPVVISITVQKGRPVGGIKRPTVKKGQVVRLVIRTDAGTEIHLHGYDIEKVPRKGVPTVIQFTARIPGRFELELHHPDALLADLTVKP
jgi:hypothetical protein